MKSSTLIGLTIVAATVAAPQAQRPVQLEAADCSQNQTRFGNRQMAQSVKHQRVPMSVGTLDVRPDGNGGVRIEPGTGDSYSITACITAGADDLAEAQRAADAVTLSVSGNKVRVSDPGQARQWSVQLIVQAPAGAQIDVETSNGPIGIRGVEGSITARASNGPIALADVSASVRAVATNGPISISGGRGNIDVETRNGPISVDFRGSRWEGELNARAQNGPLSVRIPDGFSSSVEISSSSRSPWNCRIDACSGLSPANPANEDEPRILRFGGGAPTVKLATHNGPVSLDRSR